MSRYPGTHGINHCHSWTQEFLTKGGYSALLTRLNELLEVEWRSVS
jgi:hypothetical protein